MTQYRAMQRIREVWPVNKIFVLESLTINPSYLPASTIEFSIWVSDIETIGAMSSEYIRLGYTAQ